MQPPGQHRDRSRVRLLDRAEDVAIVRRVRDRAAADTGGRTSLADVAAELGVDLDAL